jgi:HAMP domain-containing protein
MRERLVVAFVGLTFAVIALFSIPRAYAIADLVEQQENRKIQRSVDLAAVAIDAREDGGIAIDEPFLASLLHEGESIRYEPVNGKPVTAGPAPSDAGPDIAKSQELDGGEVTLNRSGAVVSDRVSQEVTPVIVLALALGALAAGVGLLVAWRLSQPLRKLADSANELGKGNFDLHIPHYAVPEAEQIAEALRRAGRQLDAQTRRQREVAVNASHQLRTPITGLRLSLEDLTLWKETPPAVAEELNGAIATLDRLAEAIGEWIDSQSVDTGEPAVDVDLTALVASRVPDWHTRARAQRRDVSLRGGPVPARVQVAPVLQVLDALADHAIEHGTGRIRVRVHQLDSVLLVRVGDSSERVASPGVIHGDAEGLPGVTPALLEAATVAESLGGYLAAVDEPRSCFALALPKPTDDGSDLG